MLTTIATCETPKANMTRAGQFQVLERDDNPYHPFVTNWTGYDDSGNLEKSWCHGGYHATLEAALKDFNTRIKRHYHFAE